jgi:hypothetical protein
MTRLRLFFCRKVSLANWQLVLLKLAAGAAWAAVACNYPEVFRPLTALLLLVAFGAGIWITCIWFQAMQDDIW